MDQLAVFKVSVRPLKSTARKFVVLKHTYKGKKDPRRVNVILSECFCSKLVPAYQATPGDGFRALG